MKTQFFNLSIFNGKGNCNHYNCKEATFHSISEKYEHIVNKNSKEFLIIQQMLQCRGRK